MRQSKFDATRPVAIVVAYLSPARRIFSARRHISIINVVDAPATPGVRIAVVAAAGAAAISYGAKLALQLDVSDYAGAWHYCRERARRRHG